METAQLGQIPRGGCINDGRGGSGKGVRECRRQTDLALSHLLSTVVYMAPKYIVELESRYPELTVGSLANAAGIKGKVTANGRRYLEKLRNAELAKVFDPRRIAVRETNLADAEEGIVAEEERGDPYDRLEYLVRDRGRMIAETDEDRLAMSEIQILSTAHDTYTDAEHRAKMQAQLFDDLDASAAVIFPGGERSLRLDITGYTIGTVIRLALVSVMRSYVETTHAAILNVKKRQNYDLGKATQAPPASSSALEASFGSTVVDVMTPTGTLTVPPESGSKDDWPWSDPLWVVTAHNPGGVKCSSSWNRGANTALRNRLKNEGIEFLKAVGRAPDGSWSESSFALVGVTKTEAVRITTEFGQLAVFRLNNWRRTVNKTGLSYVDSHPAWWPLSDSYSWDSSSEWYCNCGHEPDDHQDSEQDEDFDSVELDWSPCTLCGCDSYCITERPWLSECFICGKGEFFHDADGTKSDCPVFYDGPTCEICDRANVDHLKSEQFDDGGSTCGDYIPRSDVVCLDTASAEAIMSLGVNRAKAMAIIRNRPHGTLSLSLLEVDGIDTKTVRRLVDSERVV